MEDIEEQIIGRMVNTWRCLLIFGILTLASVVGYGQPEFTDFIQANNRIFVLSNEGVVSVWDLKHLEKIGTLRKDSLNKITAITSNTANDVFVGTEKGEIYRINSDLTCTLYRKLNIIPFTTSSLIPRISCLRSSLMPFMTPNQNATGTNSRIIQVG